MAKPRFRFSDMLPSSWFHKQIGDNSKSLQKSQNPNSTAPNSNNSAPSKPKKVPNRSSFYLSSREREERSEIISSQINKQNLKRLDTQFPLEPLISPKLRYKQKPSKSYYVKPISSVSPKNIKFRQSESFTETKSPKDIIFDLGPTSPEINLRPILTKPTSKKEKKRKNRGRKIKVSSSISPRYNSKRRWIQESIIMEKSSKNAAEDFTESMIEMIVENKITKTEDLEELLACYLSLNSKEYHDVIVKVFEKLWMALSSDI